MPWAVALLLALPSTPAATEESFVELVLDPALSLLSIDIEAGGMLKALAHDREIVARPEALRLVVPAADGPFAVSVATAVAAAEFAPSGELRDWELREFLETMRGPKVLDAGRYPRLEFRGEYRGTMAAGVLEGDLMIRGAPRRLRFDVQVEVAAETVTARALWSGRLTDLGIEPYRGMLGTMRLKDKAELLLVLAFRRP